MDNINATDHNDASITRGAGASEMMTAQGCYYIDCYGADGVLKWSEIAPNTVTFQGKNGMLDTYFAGSAYTASWSMSLITAGTATTASTYATPIVTETTSAVIAARIVMTWGASASGVKAATTTAFSIIGTATITGNMVVAGGTGVATVGNVAATGGILFSAATFGTAKAVANGDTLNVTYSITV